MPFSSLPTVSAGQTIASATWGNVAKANEDYLAAPPACRVYHDTTQSIADNSLVAAVFNSERFDPSGMHSTASLTGRITFNDAGVYLIGFHGRLAGGNDYLHTQAQLRLNGTDTIAVGPGTGPSGASSFEPVLNVVTLWKVSAGAYAEVLIYQDNSANAARNLLSTASFTPEFWAAWQGLGT